VSLPQDWDIDGIPVKAGQVEFYDNGRPRQLVLARGHAVAGTQYGSGMLLRFDWDGQLLFAAPWPV
jgi:hypothetical protein